MILDVVIAFIIGFFVSWFTQDYLTRWLLDKPEPFYEEIENVLQGRVKPTLLFHVRYLLINGLIFRKIK